MFFWSIFTLSAAILFRWVDHFNVFIYVNLWLLNYPHEAEWTPFQTHYFSENLVTPGIENGTSGHVPRNSEH
jgi:hypothetical protein